MGQKFLMDTNAVIDYCGGKLPTECMMKMNEIADSSFNISPIVKIEVLGFNGPPAEMQKLEALLSLAQILHINDAVITATIELRKTRRIKLGDAITAATALTYNLTLLSRNTKDFADITGSSLSTRIDFKFLVKTTTEIFRQVTYLKT